MARFTRHEIFPDEPSHNGRVTVTRQSQPPLHQSLINEPYRSIEESEELIIRVLESAIAPLPRSKVAKLIGRKKSPHLNRLLEGLVSRGIAYRSERIRPNGVVMYLYEIQRWG